MTFDELLTQVFDLLQRQRRLSYRVLKARWQLDDDLLETLKDELIYAQRVATDEDGRVLVWAGVPGTTLVSAPAPASTQEREPLSYTPLHLAAKILTSRSALEGERKQVTVLFCDLANSTALAKSLGPEAMHTPAGTVSLHWPWTTCTATRAPLISFWAMALWPCLAPVTPLDAAGDRATPTTPNDKSCFRLPAV